MAHRAGALRILFITELFPDPDTGLGYWGGGERQFYEVASRAVKAGHRATVLTCRLPGQSTRSDVDGVDVRRTGISRDPKTGGVLKSPLRVAEYIAKTVAAAADIDCDLVHCNAFYPVFAGRAASELKGVPLVSTFHDVPSLRTWEELTGSRVWGGLGHLAVLASVMAAGGQVITVSEQARAKLAALGRGRAHVIPNGVDASLLDAAKTRKSPGQVLFVGRLVKYKMVDVLVRALGRVRRERPEANLVIVGDGPERGALEALAGAVAPGGVEFKGTLASNREVAQLYKESSVFVLPSVAEGEGIVLKEAMAASLPVIAARAEGSGVLGLVKDGVNGFLVPPDDHDQLAGAILRVLKDGGLRDSMGAAGRRMAEAWTWDETARRVFEVYQGAAPKR
ncbi:MAG: glycosyltransferase family 4 protein [Thaumarchaeota archaeon]|nr:glycosyltransferase family 4 protein [Nitrososphaerota archaeon]